MPAAHKILKILWISLYFPQKCFLFFENLGNPPRISRICSEISPAGLGISRPGRNPPNLTTPKNRSRQHFLPSKIFFGGMEAFEVADSGCFWISLRFQFSSTEWQFWVPRFPPTPPTSSLVRTLGGHLIRGSPNLVEISKIDRIQ